MFLLPVKNFFSNHNTSISNLFVFGFSIICEELNITNEYYNKKVLKDISFDVQTGERVALIGRNWAGKITIFDIISEKEKWDEGVRAIRNGARIGYLEQIQQIEDKSKTVRDVIYSGQQDLLGFRRKNEWYCTTNGKSWKWWRIRKVNDTIWKTPRWTF